MEDSRQKQLIWDAYDPRKLRKENGLARIWAPLDIIYGHDLRSATRKVTARPRNYLAIGNTDKARRSH